MDKLDLIYDLVQEIISKRDAMLKETREENENEEVSFYDLGLDEDGCPYSFGNADDVYSDGFQYGEMAGEYYLAHKINDILHGKVTK